MSRVNARVISMRCPSPLEHCPFEVVIRTRAASIPSCYHRQCSYSSIRNNDLSFGPHYEVQSDSVIHQENRVFESSGYIHLQDLPISLIYLVYVNIFHSIYGSIIIECIILSSMRSLLYLQGLTENLRHRTRKGPKGTMTSSGIEKKPESPTTCS